MENNNNAKTSALLIATLASFVSPFIAAAINIALPAIGSEFQTNAILLSWIPTSFFTCIRYVCSSIREISRHIRNETYFYLWDYNFYHRIIFMCNCTFINVSPCIFGSSGNWICNDICYKCSNCNPRISTKRKR